MNDRSDAPGPEPIVLAHRQPFRIGALEVRPATRELVGPDSRETIEPRIMQVLVALHAAGGEILSRDDLTTCCWEGRIVGDDAINRVISKLRRLGETVGRGAFRIETITKVGYRLVTGDGPPAARKRTPEFNRRDWIVGLGAAAAVGSGFAYWLWPGTAERPALPPEAQAHFDRGRALLNASPSDAAVDAFQRAADAAPGHAEPWGWLALAIELGRFQRPPESGDLLETRSRAAAERALAIDARNSAALTAQAFAMPLFGNWLGVELRLREVLEIDPDQPFARDFLFRLLESVGRTREALATIEPYRERVADYSGVQYRIAILLWSAGRQAESDAVIDRALAKWPENYAVWFSRYWLYVRGGRPERALEMSKRLRRPGNIPAWNFDLNDLNAHAVLTRAPTDIDRAVAANREYAPQGAGFCENAINLAAQLGLLDEAFALADAYYFGRGFRVTAQRFAQQQSTFTPTYRRFTAFLFTPICRAMHADPRFRQLTEETGLASYWRRSGSRADMLA